MLILKYSASQLWSHISLWVFYLAIIPCLFLASYINQMAYGTTKFLIDLLVLLIGAYLGYFQSLIKYKLLMSPRLPILLKHLFLAITYCITLGLPLLYALWIYENHVVFLIGWYILFLTIYVKFYKSYGLNYKQLMTWEICIVAAFIYLAAMLVGAPSFIPLLFVLVVALYLFLNNQSTLDALLQRSQKNTPMIAAIRRNNTKWLCLIISFILVVYPFRKILGNFVLTLIKNILLVIGAIIRLISQLIPIGNDELALEIPKKSSPMLFPEATHASINPLEILLWCLTFIILFSLRRQLWKIVMDFLRDLQKLILAIYHALFNQNEKTIEKNTLYEETIETFNTQITTSPQKAPRHKTQLRRQLKLFFKLPNSEMKYRLGFKLLLEGLQLKGIHFSRSHTPREIAKIVKQDTNSITINEETYERIRYGEMPIEPGNIEDLESSLITLIKK